MNFPFFELLVQKEYRNIQAEHPEYPYSLNDVVGVFRKFFQTYEQFRGEQHPPLKREKIREYILRMPRVGGELRGEFDEIEPEDYNEMIDRYFAANMKGCDYRIGHFFSGDVRTLRLYECIYE